jgi:hypothetical protein
MSVTCTDGSVHGANPQVNACAAPGDATPHDLRCPNGIKSYSLTFSIDALALDAWTANATGKDVVAWAIAGPGQYKFRIVEFATNVVSSTPAKPVIPPDPGTGFGTIPYSPGQAGDTTVNGADMIPRVLPLPGGVIASAPARSGAPLSVPLIGDELMTLTPYKRVEFHGRPPGGTYALTILSGGKANMCLAKDVEIYMKLVYWIRNGN